MKKIYSLGLALCFGTGLAFGQEHSDQSAGRVGETFHSYMGVNLQTVMHPGKQTLSYRISHRLGDFDSGVLNMFGLDGPASIYLGFDYGIKDNLTVTFGRQSTGKLLEGAVKWTPLRQSGSMPISLGVFGKSNMTYAKDEAAAANGYNLYSPNPDGSGGSFSNRMSYITQVMVARKFGDRFSLQISPTWVHVNLVETNAHSNDIFSAAAIAEFKFGKKSSVSGEYSYVLNKHFPDSESASHKHECGLSYNIRTGGHIFQILLVNSFAINEANVIPYTSQDWFDGKFRIGFNIMRSFWL